MYHSGLRTIFPFREETHLQPIGETRQGVMPTAEEPWNEQQVTMGSKHRQRQEISARDKGAGAWAYRDEMGVGLESDSSETQR